MPARCISRECRLGRSVLKDTFHVAERVRSAAGACSTRERVFLQTRPKCAREGVFCRCGRD
jgi:hypothetical protein